MEHAASFEQKINNNIVSSLGDLDFSIGDLKRKIDLATGQKKVDLVVKNASIVNVFSGEIHKSDVAIADGIFVGLGKLKNTETMMPKMLSMFKEDLCVLDL